MSWDFSGGTTVPAVALTVSTASALLVSVTEPW